jgi:sugar/nucleoside kinase (ribokinase family)
MPNQTPSLPKGLFVGLATVDLIYTVDEIPRRNQKISVPGQQISAGGPATNAAVTFAFLGGRAELVSAASSHPLATLIRDDLREHSVRLHDLASGCRTAPPVSSILIHRASGERTVASANATVFSEKLGGRFNPQWLRGASVLLVDGHYMPLCIAAARAARDRGVRVVLDSGSWKEGMDKLLPLVNIAVCSDDYRPPGCRSIDDVFEFLQARNIRQIAITRSASPIRFSDHNKSGSIAVEKVQSKDTLGAGDIFHGAFCFYSAKPKVSFREALRRSAQVAGFSCRYPGTRAWMREFPSRMADSNWPLVTGH